MPGPRMPSNYYPRKKRRSVRKTAKWLILAPVAVASLCCVGAVGLGMIERLGPSSEPDFPEDASTELPDDLYSSSPEKSSPAPDPSGTGGDVGQADLDLYFGSELALKGSYWSQKGAHILFATPTGIDGVTGADLATQTKAALIACTEEGSANVPLGYTVQSSSTPMDGSTVDMETKSGEVEVPGDGGCVTKPLTSDEDEDMRTVHGLDVTIAGETVHMRNDEADDLVKAVPASDESSPAVKDQQGFLDKASEFGWSKAFPVTVVKLNSNDGKNRRGR